MLILYSKIDRWSIFKKDMESRNISWLLKSLIKSLLKLLLKFLLICQHEHPAAGGGCPGLPIGRRSRSHLTHSNRKNSYRPKIISFGKNIIRAARALFLEESRRQMGYKSKTFSSLRELFSKRLLNKLGNLVLGAILTSMTIL